jgi:hypothetical protein
LAIATLPEGQGAFYAAMHRKKRPSLQADQMPSNRPSAAASRASRCLVRRFRRFGSEVTIIEMAPRLIRREDEDVSAAVREILEREGINVRLDAKCLAVRKQGDEITVTVDCTSGSPARTGDLPRGFGGGAHGAQSARAFQRSAFGNRFQCDRSQCESAHSGTS